MNYPYAVSQIKVLENRIFDKNKLNKLIKTDKSEFIDTLIEMGYGNDKDRSIEKIITSELQLVKNLLDEITPEKKYTDLFFLENDALNIKVLYKMKIFDVDDDETYIEGAINYQALKLSVFENDDTLLSKDQKALLTTIREKLADVDSPRMVSAVIDNSVYSYILNKLKKPKLALNKYFNLRIDIANILTFIRSRRLDWDFDQFLEMYINGGNITQEEFKNAYEKLHDEVLRIFNKYQFDKIAKGLKSYFDHLDLNILETYFDNLVLESMKEFRYDSFDIGPIIYYFLEKQAEAKNIRMIYASEKIDVTDLLDY